MLKEHKKHGGEKAGQLDTEKVEGAQGEFDKLNQTLRRELEHFDNVMKDEFGQTFNKYHKQYRTALSSIAWTGNLPLCKNSIFHFCIDYQENFFHQHLFG